jgi:hypothetical protein
MRFMGWLIPKILTLAELDLSVLSYLDLEICSYAMRLTRDDVLDGKDVLG